MKLLNLSFYPIKKEELDYVKYRHQHDKEVFSAFGDDWEVIYLRLVRDHNASKNDTPAVKYFPGRSGFFEIPWQMINYAKAQAPTIVFLHSFLFPLQFLVLRLMLDKHTKYIVQHHAEFPFRNFLKSFFQRKAYRKASLFLFAAPELSVPFIKKGVVDDPSKVLQLMEVSSVFEPVDVPVTPQHADHGSKPMFLWVGRLDANKDPLTVIEAFANCHKKGKDFRLYMLYGSNVLEGEVKQKISEHQLTHDVILLGQRPHDEVRHWMSQSDYYVSASHHEGSGIALSEAMACGCVPVVTNIPSFSAMTRNGTCAYLFKPGDVNGLTKILAELPDHPDSQKAEAAKKIFKEDLSPHAISRGLCAAVNSLSRK